MDAGRPHPLVRGDISRYHYPSLVTILQRGIKLPAWRLGRRFVLLPFFLASCLSLAATLLATLLATRGRRIQLQLCLETYERYVYVCSVTNII